MNIEVVDCFRHMWIVDHIRYGNMSKAFLDGKAVLSKKDIEFELGARDKDVLVDWFQYQVEQQYMLSWADTDYAIGLVDFEYRALGDSIQRYDWFMFTAESDNILSMTYADDVVAMLEAGEQILRAE